MIGHVATAVAVDNLRITVQAYGQTTPIIIFRLEGRLDFESEQSLLALAQEAYGQGARRLVITLDGISEIRLSGLFALGNIVRLFAGLPLLDPEGGWSTLKQMDRDWPLAESTQVKLITSKRTLQTRLACTYLHQRLAVYANLADALSAF